MEVLLAFSMIWSLLSFISERDRKETNRPDLYQATLECFTNIEGKKQINLSKCSWNWLPSIQCRVWCRGTGWDVYESGNIAGTCRKWNRTQTSISTSTALWEPIRPPPNPIIIWSRRWCPLASRDRCWNARKNPPLISKRVRNFSELCRFLLEAGGGSPGAVHRISTKSAAVPKEAYRHAPNIQKNAKLPLF